MNRSCALNYLFFLLLAAVLGGCGAGRKAAWERPVSQPPPAEASPTPPPTPAPANSAAPSPAPAAVLPTTSESNEVLASKALNLWTKRDDRAALQGAITAWEQLSARQQDQAELAAHLSRAYYLLADGSMRLAGENEAMLATFEKGVLAGERALMGQSADFAKRVQTGEKIEDAIATLPATSQSALYWYATNLGKFAIAKGFTTQLFYKDRIFAVMQRVLAIDQSFFYGAPHRYFGAFYAKAPAFAGGDMKKSREHFDQALAINSNYFSTKVLYAEHYATRAEDRALFTRLLSEVRDADPTLLPDVIPEQHIEQEKARRLLAQVDEIF